MLPSVLFTIRYVVTLIYGILMIACFAGVMKRGNGVLLLCEFLLVGSVEGIVLYLFGRDITFDTYPLHTHALLVLFCVLVFQKKLFSSIIYVLWAYMCCQIPTWISSLVQYFSFDTMVLEFVVYLLVVCLSGYLIGHYLGDKVTALLEHKPIVKVSVSIIPITYYLFDYSTTVWTNSLYLGNFHVAKFMPIVIATAYLFFLCVYGWEQRAREKAIKGKIRVENQKEIVSLEMERLHDLERMSESYRKDMHNHFSLLLQYLSEENGEKAQEYIRDNISAIDKITPRRFCDNQMLNMLLSYFASVAEGEGIAYQFTIALDRDLPFTNSELCALVANALENALNGIRESMVENPVLNLNFSMHNDMLVFSLDNSCKADLLLSGQTLASSHGKDHGYGTRSIRSIANKYGGTTDFHASNGSFQLMVAIPLS